MDGENAARGGSSSRKARSGVEAWALGSGHGRDPEGRRDGRWFQQAGDRHRCVGEAVVPADTAGIGLCDGVARDAWFGGRAVLPSRFVARATALNTVPAEQAACASLFSLPALLGPDPLGACQWDMRAINATTSGSYAVDRGSGHGSVTSTPASTSLILTWRRTSTWPRRARSSTRPRRRRCRPSRCRSATARTRRRSRTTTATARTPPERSPRRSTVRASRASPRRRPSSLSRRARREGYFFTDSVVDSLMYAGDKRLDAVNMSFFADPWLFNCRNNAEQRAIVQAISRAASYAQQRGVVLVAAAGNEGIDLSHPTTDEISPDFPPGAAVSRPVNNNCVVLPTEISGCRRRIGDGRARTCSRGTRRTGTTSTWPRRAARATRRRPSTRPRPCARAVLVDGERPRVREARRPACQGPVTGEYYAWLNGTSMAAPHATGVVALIRAAHPGMPIGAVIATLRSTATPGLPERTRPGRRVLRRSGAGLQGRRRQQQLLREGTDQRAGRSARIARTHSELARRRPRIARPPPPSVSTPRAARFRKNTSHFSRAYERTREVTGQLEQRDSLRKIADDLNEAGVPTAQGGRTGVGVPLPPFECSARSRGLSFERCL